MPDDDIVSSPIVKDAAEVAAELLAADSTAFLSSEVLSVVTRQSNAPNNRSISLVLP